MSPEEIIDLALERYERPLIGYARSITGDPESARDAVQETFLRLSRQNLAALERRVAPWLFSCVAIERSTICERSRDSQVVRSARSTRRKIPTLRRRSYPPRSRPA